MRDDLEYLLEIIHREGGWRAFVLNLVTFTALGVMLYALVMLSPAARP